MSVLLETTQHLVAASSGGDGLLDLVNTKLQDAQTTIKLGGGTFIIGIFVYQTIKGGFTVGKLLMGAVLMGVFLFIINNSSFFADKTDAELNSAPAVVVTHSPHGGSDGTA